ncbi:class I SAM-dependent methyltransferase [Rheinheimera texasensis]|uniref:class I SAM-dependent methyltransferase n=1 Tax=Rheinheimera texasensis TaxID=306205 RepID=UPI0004E0FE5E|nr:class I SAM-dependent methyltransferase [Rheinheimera texasensis]
MSHDFFAAKAAIYEQNPQRVDNVVAIGQAIKAQVALQRDMQLLDFGSGTGLLLQQIAPLVAKITAVDVSPSMNAQLRAKAPDIGCQLEVLEQDLLKTPLNRQFDGIISSMTLHHIADIPALLREFHRMLKPGGFIALADLDIEDGSFHTEDTGVFHCGFDRADITAKAQAAGFTQVQVVDASVVQKPQGQYPVFLLTGRR